MSKVYDQLLRVALRVDPYTSAGDELQSPTTATVTITGAANNGSGLIRITAAGHGYATGDFVTIDQVAGTTEANNTLANPYWTVTYVSSSTFDLQGSTFTNAYSSGGIAVKNHVAAVPGEKFTAQRLIDVYNDARRVVAAVVWQVKSPYERSRLVSGITVRAQAVTFASGSGSKPSGYVKSIGPLVSSGGTKVPILPLESEGFTKHLESANNPFVYETASTFVSPNGSTYVANGDYSLSFYKVLDWTKTDAYITPADETFNPELEPILVDVAVAIAEGQGEQAVRAAIIAAMGGNE